MDGLRLSSPSELHPAFHTATPCVPSSSPCVLRSRYRLGAQTEPRCVTLTLHSTSVNLSFFIFKNEENRGIYLGTSVYITETCSEKGAMGNDPRVTVRVDPGYFHVCFCLLRWHYSSDQLLARKMTLLTSESNQF